MPNFKAAADLYCSRGWPAIPVEPGTKHCPYRGVTGHAGQDKHPSFFNWDERHVAVRMPEGVIALDVDAYEKNGLLKTGDKTIAALESDLGVLPATWRSSARPLPSGHRFYRVPAGLKFRNNLPHVDIIQRHHRLAVTFPTPHKDIHEVYRWYGPEGVEATEVPRPEDLPELPQAWIDFLTKKPYNPENNPNVVVSPRIRNWSVRALASLTHKIAESTQGHRNDDTNKYSFVIGTIVARGGISQDEAFNAILDACCSWESWDEDLTFRTINNGLTSGIANPATPWPQRAYETRDWNDVGNADRFWDEFQGKFMWVRKFSWFTYDGRIWKGIGEEEVRSAVVEMIRSLSTTESLNYSEDTTVVDEKSVPSMRERFTAWQAKQMMKTPIFNTVALAQGRQDHTDDLEKFNADTRYLNVTNGILDLETYELLPHSPSLLTTMGTNCSYDPRATRPDFDKFVCSMLPDENIRLALQVMLGYAVFTDMNPAKILPILLGAGDSGKSTILEIVHAVMGGVVKGFELSLLKGNSGGPNPELFDIINAKMVYTTEASAEWQLRGDFIKRLTGNDLMQSRPNYAKGTLQKIPSFVPFIATNSMPDVVGADKPLKNRMKVVPFDTVLPKDQRDTTLATRLPVEEGAGILNWLLEGFEMYKQGQMPEILEALTAATDEAFIEMSIFAQFLSDEGVPIDGFLEPTAHIGEVWETWRERHNEPEITHNKLGRELTGLDWLKYQGKVRCVEGEDPQWARVGFKLKSCPKCALNINNGRAKIMTAHGVARYDGKPVEMPDINTSIITGGKTFDQFLDGE